MKRRKPLRADPTNTRAWQQRSRDRQRELERTVERSAPTRRREEKRNPFARGWTQRVFALYGRECLACSTPRRRVRAVQAHHAVPRQTIANADHLRDLPEEQRQALEYDARNGVPLCERCHMGHESRGTRETAGLKRSILPAGVIAWAREWRFEHVLDRIYGKGGR